MWPSAAATPPVAVTPQTAPGRVNPWFVRFGYTPAHVLQTNKFLKGENAAGAPIRRSQSFTVELGYQTDGSRDWQHLYFMPAMGVGFYVGGFDDETELGRPMAAYAFASWPFVRPFERLHVTTDFGFGIAWGWKPYDPETNPYNQAIGADLTYHINWGFFLRYLMNQRASLYGGLDFTHWSNGGIQLPNGGVNVIGPKIGLRYNLGPQPMRPPARPWPRFRPAWEFIVGAGGSAKNKTLPADVALPADERRRSFWAFNVTTGLQRQFYHFGKFAAGADVTYDGSTGARLTQENGELVESRVDGGDRYALGVYGGYEHIIHRFSLIVQIGYAVWRGYDDPDMPKLYQRYGFRYHLTDRFWGTMALRSIYGGRANFIEFGGGYRLRWE